MAGHVFISHSTKDAPIVTALRQGLEAHGSSVWTDSRPLAPGDLLGGEIREAIDDARSVLAVLSPRAVNSKWMRVEIDSALAIGRRVIPLLIAPMEVGSLAHFFGDDVDAEPVAMTFDPGHERLDDLLPRLRVALGELEPDEPEPVAQPAPAPLAELIVRLDDPEIDESDGERRARATATLRYVPPAGSAQPEVESRRFPLRAPIGPIEAGELAWYLERFAVWPSAIYKDRAEAVERQLAEWGQALFDALDTDAGGKAWEAFRGAPADVERAISIRVDPDAPEGVGGEEAALIQEAASLLLGLPWELLYDGEGFPRRGTNGNFLAAGKRGVRVRRRLPNREVIEPLVTPVPVRVLVVSPRPEDERASYIDHRVSARPLVEALADLGGRVELEILGEPTLTALSEALAAARRPYHVVHFDGHGIYSREHGLGMLCFEDPADGDKLERRRTDLVTADQLAEVMREHRVPLVFLEASQSAMADEDPSASVAGRLLRGGVASVLAMSHSVLVATAQRFVEVFYARLSAGATVGASMLAAQRGLRDDPSRGRSFFGDLKLADWFVPVLYQTRVDPQLVRELPGRLARADIALRGRKAVEDLPASPEHGFVGRSRELLKVERLLVRERFAVLLGEGGEGKTTLAVELARWLVKSRRFEKAAFVSVEDGRVRDARAVLSVIGQQLVPGFGVESDFERAWRLVELRLRDRPTLLVFDNMESVLPSAELGVFEPEVLEGILGLAARCMEVGATRVVFTSRSELPALPGEKTAGRNVVRIGRLEPSEAVEIVAQVLGISGDLPAEDGEGAGDEDVGLLVETAQHHARSLVLLAQEVQRSGVRRTTEGLRELMVTMADRFPDDRERSLFASVELSLRRLPEGMREKLRRIGVFQGGGHLSIIANVLGLGNSPNAAEPLAQHLIDVGLAEMMPYQYLRLHPALPPMMLHEMSDAEREETRGVWVEAMTQLVGFLYQQKFKDAQLAAVLTLLELPNLLSALDALGRSHGEEGAEAEHVVEVATSLEGLLQHLGRPKALARVVEAREEASRRLGEWGQSRYLGESATIDRLLDAGRVAEAVAKAEELLRKARVAGTSEDAGAYAGASYDLAMACIRLGRALKMAGAAAAAIEPLREAQQRFGKLAEAGDGDADVNAKRMASACLTETADCLTALGRLDEAAQAYEAAIELDERRGDRRDVAAGKFQLGTVRMHQRRYGDALEAQSEARVIFEQLGEPGSVAAAWHQIGMVHGEAGQLDAAEHAYQQSLAVWVQRGDRPGEANTLGQLGNLYSRMGRLEDSVRFYRDGVSIAVEIGDLKNEGTGRNNLADKLVKLRRYDEARQEIRRAIECKKPFGHAATPWKAFMILHNLERALDNADAAAEAHQRAIEAFLAYRRDGGENLTGGMTAELCLAVRQAIVSGEVDEVASQLAQLAGQPDLPDYQRQVIPALQAILSGSRDPAPASDPGLDYDDAVELRLLLESLPGAKGEPQG